MAKKGNYVSIGKLESMMDHKNTVTLPLPGVDGAEVTIKRYLTLDEMLDFVNSVVMPCFVEEDGSYLPEAYDMSLRAALLTIYGNFRLPENLDRQYDLLYRTHAVEIVKEHIDQGQFREIMITINKEIKHKRELIYSQARAEVKELMNQVGNLVNKIDTLADQSGRLYQNISPEDTANMVKRISNMDKLDEHELVRAVLDGQMEQKPMEENVVPFPGGQNKD